jgi:GNAT superfamily N-acetyltransferase
MTPPYIDRAAEGILYNINTGLPPRAETDAIYKKHYMEVAEYKDLFKLAPDYVGYERAGKMGQLFSVCARDRGTLIGYVVILVKEHAHYQGTLCAIDDMYYLDPLYRRRGIGQEMWTHAMNYARELGAKLVLGREKLNHRHGNFFAKMGFEPFEIIYAKRL